VDRAGLQPRPLFQYDSFSLDGKAFELFDILNHPNWSNPVTDPTGGSFGKVTGKSNDDRQMQLALKYIF
jgi:hypothetical protein